MGLKELLLKLQKEFITTGDINIYDKRADVLLLLLGPNNNYSYLKKLAAMYIKLTNQAIVAGNENRADFYKEKYRIVHDSLLAFNGKSGSNIEGENEQ